VADLCYHELAPRRSLGRRLMARGHLRPVVDQRAVRHFVDHPPNGTRAAVRGALVQALQRTGRPYDISWTTCRVHVGSVRQELSLMDPLANHDAQADALLAELDRLPAPAPDATAAG
jgi:proteasome accessory factor A